MWVVLPVCVKQKSEDVRNDQVADVGLGKVCPVQTIKTIRAHNTCLRISLVALAPVDKEAVPGTHDILLQIVYQFLNFFEVATSHFGVKVVEIVLQVAIAALL